MEIDDYREIPAYKRKKPSDTSKSSKKASHKHAYKECLLRSTYKDGYIHLCKGRICKICNRVVIDDYFITKAIKGNCRLMLNNEEILEAYKHLEIIDIEK